MADAYITPEIFRNQFEISRPSAARYFVLAQLPRASNIMAIILCYNVSMPRKLRKHSALMLPSRHAVTRVGQFFLMMGLLVMVVMGRSGSPAMVNLRMHLADALVPVLSVASAPFDAVKTAGAGLKNWATTYRDNQQLMAQNRELLKWQALAKDMKVENDKLRALLSVAPRRGSHFVSATIVSEHGSAFSSSALINAGSEDGVAKNQAVISERGLVGRVMQVGSHSAQVLLLSDMNSRIPVMNERTREKMILVGRGTELPVLSYVATDSASKKGDRIVTSGDGGVFPKNIAVGVIRDGGKGMQVEPFAMIADTEYVSAVQYDQ